MENNGEPRRWAFRKAIIGYEQWLETLGYSKSTVYAHPRQLKEFLLSLEKQGIDKVCDITEGHLKSFVDHFSNRPNRRREGGLSVAHINKQIDVLNKFMGYAVATSQHNQLIKLKKLKEVQSLDKTVLTQSQVRRLYGSTTNDVLGLRDRAMLSLFYGCGLRKSEGMNLEVADIHFGKKQLHVTKSKNGDQRIVPVSGQCLKDLETYIYQARPLLLTDDGQWDKLLISRKGLPMSPDGLSKRFQTLKDRDPVLKGKTFGLHTLRHSIATHLMQGGMSLENIALFLGHRSLDSTQIYTHIIHRLRVYEAA